MLAAERGLVVGDAVWVWTEGPYVVTGIYSDKYGELVRLTNTIPMRQPHTSARVEYTFKEPTDNYRYEYKDIIGLKISDVRSYTDEELESEWGGEGYGCVIILEDGTPIHASRDDEGNGPGAIFVGWRVREEDSDYV